EQGVEDTDEADDDGDVQAGPVDGEAVAGQQADPGEEVTAFPDARGPHPLLRELAGRGGGGARHDTPPSGRGGGRRTGGVAGGGGRGGPGPTAAHSEEDRPREQDVFRRPACPRERRR